MVPFAFIGCVGISDIPQSGSNESTIELCAKYADRYYMSGTGHELPNMKAELKRRRVFSSSEWRLIDEQSIRVGMSVMALICAWGTPDRINRSSYGDAQYVFTHHGRSYGQYVYVNENTDRVTAWN